LPKAVVPGSFDPVTRGHADVIGRAAGVFDEIVVAVLVNDAKAALFSPEERLDMVRQSIEPASNVTVTSFSGLLVDFCNAERAAVIVKGVRSPADIDAELQMAQLNRRLAAVETVLLPASPELGYISSSRIKEIARLGGDVSDQVSSYVWQRLQDKLTAAG
jgi:pantetheine-phosphate adenylyltransferase